MEKLTRRQMRFVEEYLIDLNATQAAIRAGYSSASAGSIGAELLKKPAIAREIEAALEALRAACVADAQEVLRYLTAVLRGELTEQVPLLCGEGCQRLTDKALGAKERLRAAELLGRRYGMFAERVALEGALPVVISGGDALED